MNRIFKYVLRWDCGEQTVPMPMDAAPFRAGKDWEGQLVVWAVVDSEDSINEARRFFVAFTGHELPGIWKTYLGTANVGRLIFHVWTL